MKSKYLRFFYYKEDSQYSEFLKSIPSNLAKSAKVNKENHGSSDIQNNQFMKVNRPLNIYDDKVTLRNIFLFPLERNKHTLSIV